MCHETIHHLQPNEHVRVTTRSRRGRGGRSKMETPNTTATIDRFPSIPTPKIRVQGHNKNIPGKNTNNLLILRNRVTSLAKCQHTQQAQHSNKVRGFTNQGHNPKSSQQYRLPDESHHTIHE